LCVFVAPFSVKCKGGGRWRGVGFEVESQVAHGKAWQGYLRRCGHGIDEAREELQEIVEF
jgi:hypothetical protein